jgi:transcriptional regulator with XRE-family HTH domain
MSLRELARRINVSPSFVSQVERGKAVPSVGTLYAVVTQLGLSLDELMTEAPEPGATPEPPERDGTAPAPASPGGEPPLEWNPESVTWSRIGVPVQRAKGRPTINLTGVTWERLTHDDDPFVDFLYVTYQPGSASCSEDDMMRHGGREYGHVISGRIDVRVGFEVHQLEAGDSIHFDSTAPHRLSNPYGEPCVAIWVVVGRRGDSRISAAANPGSNHLPGLI